MSFWRDLGQLFSFGGSQRRSQERLDRIMKRSKSREQWYHDGPWWKHPRWGGVWDDIDKL